MIFQRAPIHRLFLAASQPPRNYLTLSCHYNSLCNAANSRKILSSDNCSSHLNLRKRFYFSRNILKLKDRGLWQDRFPSTGKEFEESLSRSQQTAYAGFDPTADALHVGNLLVIMALLHCQRAGHKPIVLLGGFTSTIGDPAGRKEQRPELKDCDADNNLGRIWDLIVNVFRNHNNLFWNHKDAPPLQLLEIVNNKDWYFKMSCQGFLELASNFPVKEILSSSFVKDRISSNDSFMVKELLYPMFQAYDWLYLYDKFNCKIQIGGNDQCGNMFRGHDLIRDLRKDSVTGLTVPLLTTADGQKLGKSAGNSVWLCPKKTSYLDFYQYFYRTEDVDVERLLKLFTFYPLSQIKEIMDRHLEDTGAQYAQKMLAKSVTRLVHGDHGLDIAIKSTEILFKRNAKALLDLSAPDLESLFNGHLYSVKQQPGITVMEAAMAAKCFPNEREGQSIIQGGGFRINQVKVTEPYLALIPDAHILPTGYTLLAVGKRTYKLICWI